MGTFKIALITFLFFLCGLFVYGIWNVWEDDELSETKKWGVTFLFTCINLLLGITLRILINE